MGQASVCPTQQVAAGVVGESAWTQSDRGSARTRLFSVSLNSVPLSVCQELFPRVIRGANELTHLKPPDPWSAEAAQYIGILFPPQEEGGYLPAAPLAAGTEGPVDGLALPDVDFSHKARSRRRAVSYLM